MGLNIESLRKELISLPVGKRCVLNAWLIRSADGEMSLDFDAGCCAALNIFNSVLCCPRASDCLGLLDFEGVNVGAVMSGKNNISSISADA